MKNNGISFSYQEREEMWGEIQGQTWDILVIGGGITGAGVAREAAYRGLKVALLERGDFACGTSSRSSKLIHGGLRYLEQMDVGLVFEAVQERYLLMKKLAPHLVRPLPFIIPVWKTSRYGMWMTHLGLTIYDGLAFFRNYKNHQALSLRKIGNLEPLLNTELMKGGFLYYDCQTDDSRLTLETILSAFEQGGTVLNYTEALSFLSSNGKICGVQARNNLTGETKEIQARCVVNAMGPFANPLLKGLKSFRDYLRPTKGVHIIVKKEDFPISHAITFPSAVDDRIMFLLPWGDFTLIGTTDTDSPVEAEGSATKEDILYILESLSYLKKAVPLSLEKVVSTYTGWRPLIVDPHAKKASEVSRKHEIFHHEEGLFSLAGGKLTTYRRMAEDLVKSVAKHCGLSFSSALRTDQIPLPGGGRNPFFLEEDRLAKIYGTRKSLLVDYLQKKEEKEFLDSSLPYQKGEVLFAVHQEMALTLKDILLRRIPLALQTFDHGQGAALEVAPILAKELGWSVERKEKELREYKSYAEKALEWRR